MLKAGTGSSRPSLGEFAGDLGVNFSSSNTSSMISGTVSTLAALFLVLDCFLAEDPTTFKAASFLTLYLGVLASSFLVEALAVDFLAEVIF
jgi:hypothetical protein